MSREGQEIAGLAARHLARLTSPSEEPFVTCSRCGRWWEVSEPAPPDYKTYDAYPACCGAKSGVVRIVRDSA